MNTVQMSPNPRTFVLELEREIDADLASDIEKQSAYVSEDLLSVSICRKTNQLTARYRPGSDTEEIQQKLHRFLEAMLQKFRKIEPTVHFEHQRKENLPYAQEVFQKLQEREWVFAHGNGQVSLHGPALRLMQALDQRFRTQYLQRFGASEHTYPAMIRAEILARCGYFEMHPAVAVCLREQTSE